MTIASSTPAEAKALLLCRHSEEISIQIIHSIRIGDDILNSLQLRKHTLIEELAPLLQVLDLGNLPELRLAVDRLKATLQSEMRTLAETSSCLRAEYSSVGTAQRRLTQARGYEPVEQPLPPERQGALSDRG